MLHTTAHTLGSACVWKRARVGGSYVSKTKLVPGERELLRSRRGDETDASIPETARYTTKKKAEKLAATCERVGVCMRACVCVRRDGEDCVRTSDVHAS